MLVIPRPRQGVVSRVVDSFVDLVFHGLAHRSRDYEERDRLLAGQAPAFLVAMLATWLLGFIVAYALMLWPWTHHLANSFRESVSSVFTLGFDSTKGGGPTSLDDIAARSGLMSAPIKMRIQRIPYPRCTRCRP